MQTSSFQTSKLTASAGTFAKGMLGNENGQRMAADSLSRGRPYIISWTSLVVGFVRRAMDMGPMANDMKMVSLLPKIFFILMTMAYVSGNAQTSPNQTAGTPNLSAEKTVRDYYIAFEKKDWNMMEQVLADGFTFTSPLDDHISVKLFRERCWPNAYKIKRIDIDTLVVNGDEAFVISDGWTTDGKLFRNSDHFKLKDGKIKEYECFFGPGISYPSSGK